MKSKTQYYTLDEIGFVGVQEKISVKQQEIDAIRTVEIINLEKSGIKIIRSERKSSKIKGRDKAIL